MIDILHSIYSQSVYALALSAGSMDSDELQISLLISLNNSELRPSWPELRDDFNSFLIFFSDIIINFMKFEIT